MDFLDKDVKQALKKDSFQLFKEKTQKMFSNKIFKEIKILRFINSKYEELKDGKNFCIIELNGAGSEPTHIYDPAHSLAKAWKEIARHYRLLYEVSRKNHRLGHPHLAARVGLRLISGNSKLVRKLKLFNYKETAA